jgi:hypothetical protein
VRAGRVLLALRVWVVVTTAALVAVGVFVGWVVCLSEGGRMFAKQVIGGVLALTTLTCTVVALAGVWGFLPGDSVWRVIGTGVVCVVGLGATVELVDRYIFGGPGVWGLEQAKPSEPGKDA